MKIGIKAFYDWPFIESLQDKADFVELMAIEGKDYSFVKNIKIPVVIHATYTSFGVNPSDSKKEAANVRAINFAIDLANETNAKKIIVHPGPLENSDCNMEIAENFLKKIKDRRVILENHADQRDIFLNPSFILPEEIKPVLDKTEKGFCLDINHAISYAFIEKIDYMDFLKKFLELNPVHFHLGGQRFKPYAEHLDFINSDIDLKKIFSILPKDAEITLEVTEDIKKTEKDLDFIRKFLR